jgi:hypothetical protein
MCRSFEDDDDLTVSRRVSPGSRLIWRDLDLSSCKSRTQLQHESTDPTTPWATTSW